MLRSKTLWDLFLEELVCGDGDGHFPRFRINEIRQRENHAIDDPDDHGDDSQEAEQAGHTRASGGELTIEFMWDGQDGLPTCSHLRCKSLWQRYRRWGGGRGGVAVEGGDRGKRAGPRGYDDPENFCGLGGAIFQGWRSSGHRAA